MTDDVRRGLTDRPGKDGIDFVRQPRGDCVDPAVDPGRSECLDRALESVGKGETPIALHCPAHIGERLAGDALDLPQLRLRAAGVALKEPGRQLGLERDQREGLAEQVVKVAGDPEALLGDGKPGPFLARPAKLTVCPGGASQGGRHGSHSEDGQRPGGDGRAVGAGDRETEPTEHGTGRGHRHRRRQREDDARNRDDIDEEHGERARSTEGQRQ